MIGAVSYLTVRSATNRARRMLARLSNPRYTIAFALGVGYLWFFLFRSRGPRGGGLSTFITPGMEVGIAFGFFLLISTSWLFGNDRSALALTPPEIQFLLPAPISRRALLHFKLFRAQIGVLFATLVWIGILRRNGSGAESLRRAVALWALFSTVSLHRLAATLVRVASTEHGVAGARRNILPMTIFGAAAGALAWTILSRGGPAFATARGLGDIVSVLAATLQQPLPSLILSPILLLIAPLTAATTEAWLRALGPALLIMLAHYLWIARSNVAFEEAATEASAKLAARIATRRNRRLHQAASPTAGTAHFRLPLSPHGFPPTAIVWKNVIAYLRALGLHSVIVMGALTVFAASFTMTRPNAGPTYILRVALPLMAGALIVFGGRVVRNDLRQDLPQITLLKSFPLEGSAIVGAEIAAATLVLTVVQLGLVLLWYALFGTKIVFPIGYEVYARAGLVVAPLVFLLVNAANITILNGAALLLPAWSKFGTGAAAGVEAIGQNLLTTLATLLILVVALVPPVIVGGIAAYSLQPSFGPWALFPGAMAGLTALGGEIALAIRYLGRVFERTDPSALL